MRPNILIAFVASLIALAACDNSTVNKQQKTSSAFNIQGTWILDSIQQGHDTSNIGPLLLAIANFEMKNLPGLHFNFKKDSIVTVFPNGNRDTAAYTVDYNDREIVVNQDEDIHQLFFTASDSSLLLVYPDSTRFFLSRKK